MIRRILIALFFLWLAGFFWFVESLPTYEAQREKPNKTDVIVVLTGGMGRIADAMGLLHQGAAPELLITGVGTDVTLAELIAQDVPKAQRKSSRYYRERVHLGYVARNTAGNVREANGWMVAHPVTSMTLVTSNYHMPRSEYLFHEAFPHMTIERYATFGPAFRSDSWWRSSDVLALAFSEYHKLLMSYVLYGFMGARLV